MDIMVKVIDHKYRITEVPDVFIVERTVMIDDHNRKLLVTQIKNDTEIDLYKNSYHVCREVVDPMDNNKKGLTFNFERRHFFSEGLLFNPWPKGLIMRDYGEMIFPQDTPERQVQGKGPKTSANGWADLDRDVQLEAVLKMEAEGGGFASALATAWLRADKGNKAKLDFQFASMFDRFLDKPVKAVDLL